jgi:putative aldouronate transport system permease protein
MTPVQVSVTTLKRRDSATDRNRRARPVRPPLGSRSVLNTIARQKYLLILVIPAVIWMIIFNYVPMLGLVISFKEYNPFLGPLKGFTQSPWVGLQQFQEAFTDRYFLHALWNTILYSLLKLLFGFPAPIIFAILLNEVQKLSFKKFVQTVSYLPHFISWVFVSGFLYEVLAVDSGVVNKILLQLRIVQKPLLFLASEKYVPSLVVVSHVWKSFGWESIIYIAAITGIDLTLYEAAAVDGANRWTRIWHITLPCIKSTIVVLLIFTVAGLISANFEFFEQMYLLSNSIIRDATEIIDTYTYRMGIQLTRYSYAAAVGMFRSVAAVILLVIANAASRRLTGQSLY